MNAALDLEADDAETLEAVLEPSLRGFGGTSFDVTAENGRLHIGVEAEKLGALRGATNTALMLTKLATNVLER